MKIFHRRLTRELALQLIYSWIIYPQHINVINKIKEIKLLNTNKFIYIDNQYLLKISKNVIHHYHDIKNIIQLNIKKYTQYINLIEESILCIAIYELKKKNYLIKLLLMKVLN